MPETARSSKRPNVGLLHYLSMQFLRIRRSTIEHAIVAVFPDGPSGKLYEGVEALAILLGLSLRCSPPPFREFSIMWQRR